MGKKKDWSYLVAGNCTYGTMICTACHKKVVSGDFRKRETTKAYLVQHRHCSKDDPKWVELDAQRVSDIISKKERLEAFIAFRDKWKVYELDEEIEELQHMVDNYIPYLAESI